MEIEVDTSPDQEEEVEFVVLHESALRDDPKFQLLENEKKKAIFQEKQSIRTNRRKIRERTFLTRTKKFNM